MYKRRIKHAVRLSSKWLGFFVGFTVVEKYLLRDVFYFYLNELSFFEWYISHLPRINTFKQTHSVLW